MKLHCARNATGAQRKPISAEKHPADSGLRQLRDRARAPRRLRRAGRHRPHHPHRYGLDHAALALPARRAFRRRRDVLLVLYRGPRQGHGDHGDSGVPASPLPPRLRVHQHHQGHQEAHRPDRQEDRHQVVPGHRDPLDARHPRTRIRRVAQIGRMGRRARRGRRLHAAAGPEDHPPAAQQVRRGHAGRGRGRRADPLRHHQADRGRRSARRAGSGRTTRPRKSASRRRRRFSRSCT